MVAPRDAATDARRLRACVRDLVALSAMPSWWIGRPPGAIADSLHDLLASMLRADGVYVQLRGPDAPRGRGAMAQSAGDGAGHLERDRTPIAARVDGVLGRAPNPGPTPPGTAADGAFRLASVPIGLGGEMGRLVVGSRRADFPNEIEALLLQMASNQVATALQYAALLLRHEDAERRLGARADQQEAVARLGLRALAGATLDEMLGEAVAVVGSVLRADCCEVLELAPDGMSLVLKAGVGWSDGLIGRARLGAGLDSPAGYTLLVGEPVIMEDLRRERRFSVPPLLAEHGAVSGISVILHDRERPFGVLGAHTHAPRTFTGDDLYFLQSVANLLATAVQRHRAELEREELLVRTAAAQAEAERASRGKSEFLAMMSHELRTPLATIAGYAELLELEIHGALTAEQRDDLRRLRRSQQYLLGLINNILTYMKVDSGRMSFDVGSVPVDSTLAAIEELIRPQMEAKQLRYEQQPVERGVAVRADAEKVQQIVLNLLSNATKFTPPGGRVRLECDVDDAEVTIRVRDSGCGIPPDKLATVFEPFVQVEGHLTRVSEGAGLGLAISGQFADAMGGRLSVESEVGSGSTFTLVLPRY